MFVLKRKNNPAARSTALRKAFWQVTSMGVFFGVCRGAYLVARS